MLRALEELGAFAYKRYQVYQQDLVGESKEDASYHHSLRSRIEHVFCHSRQQSGWDSLEGPPS